MKRHFVRNSVRLALGEWWQASLKNIFYLTIFYIAGPKTLLGR
ncbi:MAG: hypothetical protein V1736_02990 [Pseudomonadota bacterium]